MYTYSDLYEIASLYYTQAFMAYYFPARRNNKQLYALRYLLYAVSAEMIYEGRY